LTVLAGQELPHGDISRYGVMDVHLDGGLEKVRAMVEKPAPGTEPSRLVAFGRYLYTREIFPALKSTRGNIKAGREFTQTDAINHLAKQGRVGVCRFVGKLLDVGTKSGYLHAIIEMALRRPEFHDDLLSFMREVLARKNGG
ncbi:MAG: UTP--glucose-1-phosphate uridylyltransferase, partial [Candidatus Lambdaproteobacteria bacterium]|nr:UTP--glucose-1-phosphate uridylyltransferase [Candidatus Lambdaproteobacteria bacterium]